MAIIIARIALRSLACNNINPFLSSVRYLCSGNPIINTKHIADGNPCIINWGVHSVPENKAYVIHRCGRYHKTIGLGTRFMIPLVDKIAYVCSLEEEPIIIPDMFVFVEDLCPAVVNSVVDVQVVNPRQVSYSVRNPIGYLICVARAKMFACAGEITLDMTSEKMQILVKKIADAINAFCAKLIVEALELDREGQEAKYAKATIRAKTSVDSKIRKENKKE